MDEKRPVSRRRFLSQVLSIGGGVLASIAWIGLASSTDPVDAGPSQPPSGTPKKPASPPAKPRPGGTPKPPAEQPHHHTKGKYAPTNRKPIPKRPPTPPPERPHPHPAGTPINRPDPPPKK